MWFGIVQYGSKGRMRISNGKGDNTRAGGAADTRPWGDLFRSKPDDRKPSETGPSFQQSVPGLFVDVCLRAGFTVPRRFYKKAAFYENTCRGGDGGGLDNYGGDIK